MKLKPNDENYPAYVCWDCAAPSRHNVAGGVCTAHTGVCGLCKQTKSVTSPRSFHWPIFESEARHE